MFSSSTSLINRSIASLTPAVLTGAHALGMVGVSVFKLFDSFSENSEVFCVPNNSCLKVPKCKLSGIAESGTKPLNADTPGDCSS